MKSKHTGVLWMAGFTWLVLTSCGILAADRDATSERELDRGMVAVLAEASELIVVGEPIEYDAQDQFEMAGYRMALNAEMPFQVKVVKVLHGDGAAEDQVINVSVTRDEVEFRVEKGRAFLFYLKPEQSRGKTAPSDSSKQTTWRIVSDYFGVQPHAVTLEKLVKSLYERSGQQAGSSQDRDHVSVDHLDIIRPAAPDAGRSP